MSTTKVISIVLLVAATHVLGMPVWMGYFDAKDCHGVTWKALNYDSCSDVRALTPFWEIGLVYFAAKSVFD